MLSGTTQHSCRETRASRELAVAGLASQAVTSRKLGTSNAKARAKVETGRNHKETARKARVFRGRAVLIDRNRTE